MCARLAAVCVTDAKAHAQERDGRLLGFVTTLDHGHGNGYLSHLAVREGSQGLGIGRTLIDASLEWMRSQGLKYATIGAVHTNYTGMHLYPDCGWIEVDRTIHWAMPLDPDAPTGQPPRKQREEDPLTRPDGPGLDVSTFAMHKLNMRMDHKAELGRMPDGSIGGNPHARENPAVADFMAQKDDIASAAEQLDIALYRLGPESQVQPGVPQGEIVPHLQWAESKVYPQTVRDWWVYVPHQLDATEPAQLMIFLDGHSCECRYR